MMSNFNNAKGPAAGTTTSKTFLVKSSMSSHKLKKSMIPLRTTNNSHSVGNCVQASSYEKHDILSSSPENKSIKRVVSTRLKNAVSPFQAANLQNYLPFLVHRGVSSYSSTSSSSNKCLRRRNDEDSYFSHKKRNVRGVHSSTVHVPENNSLDKNHSEGDIAIIAPVDNPSTAIIENRNNANQSRIQGILEWKDSNILAKIANDSNVSSATSVTNSDASCSLKTFAKRVAETAGRTRGYFLCPICSEPINKPAIIACGHLFCMSCVCSWFESQDNCPCCRYRVVSKDIGTSLILAKEYFDASRLLASIFTAANFHTLMDTEPLSCDLEKTSSLLSCNTSKQILESHLAPIFRHLFNWNGDSNQQKSESDDPSTQQMTNCTRAAIWFVRRCLLLRRPCEGPQTTLEDSELIEKLPTLIKQEAFRGSESSREFLVRQVMLTMKQSKMSSLSGEPNPCFQIPRPSITQSKRKSAAQQRFFRLRFPSANGLIRFSISTTLFLMISLVLYLVEGMNKLAFSKVDFIVYSFIMVSMLIHTEERIRYRRRRRNNLRNGTPDRGSQRRRNGRNNSRRT